MIHMVHPSHPTGSKSQGQDTEPGYALPFPLAEQWSRRHVPRLVGSAGGLGLMSHPPTLPSGSDTSMALPSWKILSEMLLSLRTRVPM